MKHSAVYEPLCTLRSIGEEIWLADGPTIGFYGMPFSTRMTVVRLEDGGLWVHSPIVAEEGLVEEVEALGPVSHLIAPNWIHYAHVPAWQARFPAAQTHAAPGVEARARRRGVSLRVDRPLGDTPPAAWAGQIDQIVVWGSPVHREAVFYHRASRTLVLTDLIENFEPEKLPWLMRLLVRAAGIHAPHGGMPRDMRLTFRLTRRGRARLEKAVAQMIAWDPERVVLAHGRWFESGGTQALRRAFSWLDMDRRAGLS
jgi:hypothetical protein